MNVVDIDELDVCWGKDSIVHKVPALSAEAIRIFDYRVGRSLRMHMQPQ